MRNGHRLPCNLQISLRICLMWNTLRFCQNFVSGITYTLYLIRLAESGRVGGKHYTLYVLGDAGGSGITYTLYLILLDKSGILREIILYTFYLLLYTFYLYFIPYTFYFLLSTLYFLPYTLTFYLRPSTLYGIPYNYV